MLLVPTFNALNVAQFDAEPPVDLNPEDVDPPEDLEGEVGEGEHEFEVPPAGAQCPAMREQDHEGGSASFQAGLPLDSGESGRVSVNVPPDAVAVGIAVTFDDWRGTLEIGPVTVDDATVSEGESFSQPFTSTQGREGEERLVYEAQPGRWTAEWSADSFTGGGGLVIGYRTMECVTPGPASGEDA